MLNALIRRARAAVTRRSRAIVAALESERGQGTVEYVGLILLVSMLMVALVAAMKGFHTSEGQDLAQLIVETSRPGLTALTSRCGHPPGGSRPAAALGAAGQSPSARMAAWP